MSGLQFNFDLFLLLGLGTFWSGIFYGDLDTKASFVVASSVHYVMLARFLHIGLK